MFESLLTHITAIYPISEELRQSISEALMVLHIPKKTLLLEEGKVCDKIYFIEKGISRAFYFKEGQEITAWFMEENNLIISVHSFFTRKPSYENIELLEDSVLYAIKFEDLHTLYKLYPEFNFVGRVLTEKYYLLSEERTMSLRMLTSQERYQKLLQSHPHLFNRVLNKHIASYLGMSAETLSRLRAHVK